MARVVHGVFRAPLGDSAMRSHDIEPGRPTNVAKHIERILLALTHTGRLAKFAQSLSSPEHPISVAQLHHDARTHNGWTTEEVLTEDAYVAGVEAFAAHHAKHADRTVPKKRRAP